MANDGVSRRHFFFGSLLAGAVPIAGYGSVPSLRALGYKPFYEKLNVASCPPDVYLMMFRKPLEGLTMQSNGLLLPPLPAEGYEQTFTNSAVAGRTLPVWLDFKMSISMVVSRF